MCVFHRILQRKTAISLLSLISHTVKLRISTQCATRARKHPLGTSHHAVISDCLHELSVWLGHDSRSCSEICWIRVSYLTSAIERPRSAYRLLSTVECRSAHISGVDIIIFWLFRGAHALSVWTILSRSCILPRCLLPIAMSQTLVMVSQYRLCSNGVCYYIAVLV